MGVCRRSEADASDCLSPYTADEQAIVSRTAVSTRSRSRQWPLRPTDAQKAP